MSHSVLYIPSVFNRPENEKSEKPLLGFVKSDFTWPLLFMLSMALVGLRFYPAFLFALAIILKRFREDRYDFVIMLMMLFGNFGLMRADILHIKMQDIALVSGTVLAVIMRKPPLLRKMLCIYAVYAVILFWIALQSWESMRVQLVVLRYYYSFIVVFVPIAAFANRSFDMNRMIRRLMVFGLTMCCFYIFDALIVKGHILLPGTFSWSGQSTFWHPVMSPFSIKPLRVYPYGMYILMLVIVAAIRTYRLPKWQWALIIVASLSTQTMTFCAGFGVILILCQGSFRRTFKILGSIALGLVLLYGVDCLLPKYQNDVGETSSLRLKSTVDQFFMLAEAADDEEIADFGSGRMGQFIPKLDLVQHYHKEWTGLGFLHRDLSTDVRFTIVNEYYVDLANNEEVATGVEVVPFQIFISAGWLGLIVHAAFFIGLYLLIRRYRYSYIYLSMLIFCAVAGLGGFASLANYEGQALMAFAFALVILANRPQIPGFSHRDAA